MQRLEDLVTDQSENHTKQHLWEVEQNNFFTGRCICKTLYLWTSGMMMSCLSPDCERMRARAASCWGVTWTSTGCDTPVGSLQVSYYSNTQTIIKLPNLLWPSCSQIKLILFILIHFILLVSVGLNSMKNIDSVYSEFLEKKFCYSQAEINQINFTKIRMPSFKKTWWMKLSLCAVNCYHNLTKIFTAKIILTGSIEQRFKQESLQPNYFSQEMLTFCPLSARKSAKNLSSSSFSGITLNTLCLRTKKDVSEIFVN